MLVCFFLQLKRDKNVWHLQPLSSIWRLLAFLPVTLSVCYGEYKTNTLDEKQDWQEYFRKENDVSILIHLHLNHICVH